MDNPEAYEEVPVLELAIAYDLMKSYPSDLDKDQKRAMARGLEASRGEWRGVLGKEEALSESDDMTSVEEHKRNCKKSLKQARPDMSAN